MLVPGVGTALGGVLGGLGGTIGSAFGLKGTLAKGLLGQISGAGIPGLSNIASGAAGGFPSVRSGLASLFGGMGGQEEYEIESGDTLSAIAAKNGTTVEALMKANGITDPNMIAAGAKLIIPGGSNFNGLFGPGSVSDKLFNVDPNKGTGPLSFLEGGSGGGMGNTGIMGISALLGKMAYDSAKDRAGGLAATPEVTMDNLGRYSLSKALGTGGTREEFGLGAAPKSFSPEVFVAMGGPIDRQYFNQGGLAAIAELDMRDGGESDGPGTGTSDDIPAMLSDGEFVMTAKATKGAGAFNVNKTKSGIELISGGKASRKKGVENMRELMNIFEAI